MGDASGGREGARNSVGSSSASITVAQHLRYLQQHPSSPSNKDAVLHAIQGLESTAKEQGLDNDHLMDMVAIITSGTHYVGLTRRLIRAMIPKKQVESRVVVRLVSRFSHPLLPRSLQPMLLQWLLAVYELVDDQRPLHKLYGVLFYWLDYASLLPHLCHLLYRLTEKKDVQPFRIRRLMRLQQHLGPEPCLTALLSCYKLFQPAMVTLVVRQTSRKRWFPALDKEMVNDIARVQRRNSTGVHDIHADDAVDVSTLLARRRHAVPQLKAAMDIFHQRHLSDGHDPTRRLRAVAAGESEHILRRAAAADVAPHIGRLALPAQVAAVLTTRNLQHVLSASSSPELIQRLSYWLFAQFADGEKHMLKYSRYFDQLLTATAEFAAFLQETPPAVEDFLERALLQWNGDHYQSSILTLIATAVPRPYEDLYPAFLQPLSSIAMFAPVSLLCRLLDCYRAVTETYTRFPWANASTAHKRRFVFHEPPPAGDHHATIEQLLAFVDAQCELALQRWPGNEVLEHHVFAIYESLGHACRVRGLPIVCIPPPGVVFDLLSSSSAFALSRVGGILATTRDDYKHHCDEVKPQLDTPPPIPHLDLFNCYIIDIINMVWRSSVFGKSRDTTILFDDIQEGERQSLSHTSSPKKRAHIRQRFRSRIETCIHANLALQAPTVHALSLAYSTWCAGYSHAFLESDSTPAHKLNPTTAQERKIELWQFLRDKCALDGLARFLISSIPRLKSRE